MAVRGEFRVDEPVEFSIAERLVPRTWRHGAGGKVELLDTVDEADERGGVVPVCKLGMVVDVADGDGRVFVAARQGTLEAIVTAPSMRVRGAVGLRNGRVVGGKARPTQQLAKCRRHCLSKEKIKIKVSALPVKVM